MTHNYGSFYPVDGEPFSIDFLYRDPVEVVQKEDFNIDDFDIEYDETEFEHEPDQVVTFYEVDGKWEIEEV